GAFGIVATVPVIVSACSSTSDNNGNNNNGGDTNQQTQSITPKIKTESKLSGALSNIYDTANTGKTNELIANEIKKNLSEVFENGEDLSKVNDLQVSVTHTFPASTWTGLSFDAASGNWKHSTDSNQDVTITDANKLLYASKTQALDISSLSDLKTQLDDTKLKAILTDTGVTPAADTTYSVANALGFTNKKKDDTNNRDLLHVNVVGTKTGSNPGTTNYDLQIPVSDLNLKLTDLSVTVKGTNVAETTEKTTLTYNIGINDVVEFVDPSAKPTVAASVKTNKETMNALKALGYTATVSGQDQIDNDKVAAALGIYNCTFTLAAENPLVIDDATNKFTFNLVATPNSGYVWEDGTNTAKPVQFATDFTVS
ncbi:hypothetical protein D8X55_05055, partial [Malacoplasma penetrans]